MGLVKVIRRPSVRRVVRRGKPRWLLSGALVSLVGYLALAVFAAQQELFALDYGTRSWVAVVRHEAWQLPMEVVTLLGDHVGLILMIAIGMALLWRGHRRWALALPVLMAGTWAVQWLAKWAAGRARPNLAPWGFPSGHVLSLVVFFGLMIYLIATASRRRRRWRLLASAVATVPVVVVAFSRLYLDKHWLSDLAGGLTIGAAYLLLAIWMVEVVLTAPDEPGAETTIVTEVREGREPGA
jgi:membrane-associated phospholipid phosphatase